MQKKSKESEEIITMIIDNVKVYTESGEFILGGIITQGDTITAVYSEREKEVTFEKMNMTADSSVQKEKLTENVIDGKGAYAIPGLIDLHFHGCMGDDFCDGDKEAILPYCRVRSKRWCYCNCSGYNDSSGRRTGEHFKNSSRI